MLRRAVRHVKPISHPSLKRPPLDRAPGDPVVLHCNMLVKKYGNRRLYDTVDSRYITLEELTEKIRGGADARIIDAKTGEDLTQATLTQVILESRGAAKLLPVPLLYQLIRLGNDALAEFFQRYVAWALEVYQMTRTGASALGPFNPFAAFGNPLARMLNGMTAGMPQGAGWGAEPQATPPAPPTPVPPPLSATSSEVAELRRELQALKRTVAKKKRSRV